MPAGPLNLVNILSETCSRDNPGAEAEFQCQWGDRWYYAAQLVGGLVGGQYQAPTEYLDFAGLYCNDVHIEKYGIVAGGLSTPLAKLVATFGTPKCKDPTSSDPLDLAEITLEASGEGLPLPQGNFTWGSDAGSLAGQTLGSDDITPTMMLPYLEGTIKLPYCTSWMLDTIASTVGCTNSNTVTLADTDFTSDQMLMLGVGLERTLTADGSEQLCRVLKIGIRQPNGWQKLYIPSQSAWASVTPTLYQQSDYTNILTMWS
jgi:hypothetical protein